MPECRLVVRLHDESPMKSVSVTLRDRSEAFLVAQRYDAPAELWEGNKNVCTISRSEEDGFWIISNHCQI